MAGHPPPATTPLGVARHLPPSGKISYAVLTYALHNGIPPCSSLLPKICPYNLFITYSCP